MESWYTKAPVPREVAGRLRTLARGTLVGEICPQGQGPVKLYQVSDDVFHALFEGNRPYLHRGDYTAPPEENDYGGGYNLVTESGLAGMYVTREGWLISVYSNEPWRGFVRLAAGFLREKVANAVCIVGGEETLSPLVRLYMEVFDLKAVAVTVDDRGRMRECYGAAFVDEFTRRRGTPHHVFLGRQDIEIDAPRYFDDYYKAREYVEGLSGK